MKDMSTEIKRFLEGMSIKARLDVDKDFDSDHGDIINVDNTFLVGFYKPDQKYFLQAIVSHAGNREEPPSEDYKEICSSKSLGNVLIRMVLEMSRTTLGNMAEEDHFDRMELDEHIHYLKEQLTGS